MAKTLFVVLGNQLFPVEDLAVPENTVFFMAEDLGLCTYVQHHQQKIVLFLAAMRSYCDQLMEAGYRVDYQRWEDNDSLFESAFEAKLLDATQRHDATALMHVEIEDKFMEQRINAFAIEHQLDQTVLPSPMFLCPRKTFANYLKNGKQPRMKSFYEQERVRLNILVNKDGTPVGDQWSFDAQNRKKLPRGMEPPELQPSKPSKHVKELQPLVAKRFSHHPGDAYELWLPTTRRDALLWLDDFLEQRVEHFGTYEDAISTRSHTVFHSVLSPLINLGIITPSDVLKQLLERAKHKEIPLNSLEGLIRQIIGWREFVRGIYQHFDEHQRKQNFWQHERQLTDSWYQGKTGIPPLDDTIELAQRYGWTHHIPRLMIVANLMTLSEIKPADSYTWFMEMYVDSSDWVMGPNVFGMGLFSDGGLFATKPYICGSNYMLKMSDYKKGPWCDVVDGLYWRFIEKNESFFSSNHRLSMMTRLLARLEPSRKERIFTAAEDFLSTHTVKNLASQ